ncbi:MAG: sulfotransferase family 2 domain-containing protein [Pseudomonadota bacterium]
MIVSHAHRFIFLKTKKTAGSSIEYSLAPHCADGDIITPASRDEEPNREGRGAQNFWLPLSQRGPVGMVRALFTDTPERYIGFYNHMPAARARQLLGETIWTGYFKFAFERNPWDRQVSLYYWRYRDPETRPGFEDFCCDPRWRKAARNWSIYSIKGSVAVDRVGRYERLTDDLKAIFETVGLEGEPALPHLKSSTREGGRDYRAHYTPAARDAVASLYEREIDAFGYEF